MFNKNFFRKSVILMVLTFAVSAIFIKPIVTSTKLGLDLQGGIEILYSVKALEGNEVDQELIDSTIDVLNRRVNTFGISETVITQEGDNMIRVQVPGVDDQASAREMLGSSAVLSFRDTSDNYLMGADVLNSGKAKLTTSQDGSYAVKLSIANPEKMREVTSQLQGQVMAIWLDFEEGVNSFSLDGEACGSPESKCISAATVQQELSNEAVITGSFTEEEASTLVGLINSGSLQVELTEEYSTSIGASFGDEALQKSVISAIIGLALIMVYIIYKYRFAGFVSSVGLLFYTLLVFVIFYILGGVLTLPGIAALILGVGMAVDANVITYERIKDSLREGSKLSDAFNYGNKDSMLTIIDANITTFIIALILYVFGQTAIKGFATMLIINIFLTFVITVIFTRYLLSGFVQSHYFDDKVNTFIRTSENSFIVNKFKAFNYVNKNRMFFLFSLLVITSGVVYGQAKGYNLGIDFTSGTSITAEVSNDEYKEINKYIDEEYNVVSTNYVDSENFAVIRLSDSLDKNQVNDITTYLQDEYDSEVLIQKVSPSIGKNLIRNSVYSLLIAIGAIVLYITFRFRSSFAFAAVAALIHDALVMVSIFAMFKFTISGDFIAALLAIIGYSINDTIVLFDRIRRNLNVKVKEATTISNKAKKKNKKAADSGVIEYSVLKELVNTSIKETVGRSLTTSFTTLLPILALIFLGASEILQFNIALAIGIVFGTYSSIFIAAQIWLLFERKGYKFGKNEDGWFSVEDVKEKYID